MVLDEFEALRPGLAGKEPGGCLHFDSGFDKEKMKVLIEPWEMIYKLESCCGSVNGQVNG